MPLQIYTTQIKYTNFNKIKENPNCLDITRKTGNLIFAPTWGMILGLKNMRLSEEKYTKLYYKLMRKSYKNNRKEWDKLLAKEKIIICCYCYNGAFCHRYLLAKILEKLGAEYKCEIEI